MDDNKAIGGSMDVGKKLAVGLDINVGRNGRVGGDFRIEGWLEARNIKGAFKGLYEDLDSLRRAWPKPKAGWWAIVGATVPGPLFIEKERQWVATGKEGGALTLDAVEWKDRIEEALRRLEEGGTSGGNQGGTVIPPGGNSPILDFGGFVSGVSVEDLSVLARGTVVFDRDRGTFLMQLISGDGGFGTSADMKYYANWGEGDNYGTGSVSGRVPYTDCRYRDTTDGKLYYWTGRELREWVEQGSGGEAQGPACDCDGVEEWMQAISPKEVAGKLTVSQGKDKVTVSYPLVSLDGDSEDLPSEISIVPAGNGKAGLMTSEQASGLSGLEDWKGKVRIVPVDAIYPEGTDVDNKGSEGDIAFIEDDGAFYRKVGSQWTLIQERGDYNTDELESGKWHAQPVGYLYICNAQLYSVKVQDRLGDLGLKVSLEQAFVSMEFLLKELAEEIQNRQTEDTATRQMINVLEDTRVAPLEGQVTKLGEKVSDLGRDVNGFRGELASYQPKGDYLTSQNLEGYATQEWVAENAEGKMRVEVMEADGSVPLLKWGTYHRYDEPVESLRVRLPYVKELEEGVVGDVMLCFETGSAPQVVIEALDETEIMYRPDYSIEGGRKYEVYLFYNGKNWIVANECYE